MKCREFKLPLLNRLCFSQAAAGLSNFVYLVQDLELKEVQERGYEIMQSSKNPRGQACGNIIPVWR